MRYTGSFEWMLWTTKKRVVSRVERYEVLDTETVCAGALFSHHQGHVMDLFVDAKEVCEVQLGADVEHQPGWDHEPHASKDRRHNGQTGLVVHVDGEVKTTQSTIDGRPGVAISVLHIRLHDSIGARLHDLVEVVGRLIPVEPMYLVIGASGSGIHGPHEQLVELTFGVAAVQATVLKEHTDIILRSPTTSSSG